jgi:Phosphopantetheine attachment site
VTAAQQWESTVRAAIKEVAGFDVPAEANFFQAGLTSALVVAVHQALRSRLDHDVAVTAFFKYPNPRALAAFLADGPVPASWGPEPAPAPARQWSAQERRELRARLRQRKG